MELRLAFGEALRELRQAKGLTQEDFGTVSSRTYLSTLERGLKSPTLDKVGELTSVLQVHPLTLLTFAFLRAQPEMSFLGLMALIEEELSESLHLKDSQDPM